MEQRNFLLFIQSVTTLVEHTDILETEFTESACHTTLIAISRIGTLLGKELNRAFPNKVMGEEDFAAYMHLHAILLRLQSEARLRLDSLEKFSAQSRNIQS
jgi:hypothetical protein